METWPVATICHAGAKDTIGLLELGLEAVIKCISVWAQRNKCIGPSLSWFVFLDFKYWSSNTKQIGAYVWELPLAQINRKKKPQCWALQIKSLV